MFQIQMTSVRRLPLKEVTLLNLLRQLRWWNCCTRRSTEHARTLSLRNRLLVVPYESVSRFQLVCWTRIILQMNAETPSLMETRNMSAKEKFGRRRRQRKSNLQKSRRRQQIQQICSNKSGKLTFVIRSA